MTQPPSPEPAPVTDVEALVWMQGLMRGLASRPERIHDGDWLCLYRLLADRDRAQARIVALQTRIAKLEESVRWWAN